jgi:hypothetical protein
MLLQVVTRNKQLISGTDVELGGVELREEVDIELAKQVDIELAGDADIEAEPMRVDIKLDTAETKRRKVGNQIQIGWILD